MQIWMNHRYLHDTLLSTFSCLHTVLSTNIYIPTSSAPQPYYLQDKSCYQNLIFTHWCRKFASMFWTKTNIYIDITCCCLSISLKEELTNTRKAGYLEIQTSLSQKCKLTVKFYHLSMWWFYYKLIWLSQDLLICLSFIVLLKLQFVPEPPKYANKGVYSLLI